MGSQSNERRIKQFLLFFKIPQSFTFSNATAKDTCFFISGFKNSLFITDNIISTKSVNINLYTALASYITYTCLLTYDKKNFVIHVHARAHTHTHR